MKTKNEIDHFKDLVKFLRKHNYEVRISEKGCFARISGKNVFGGFHRTSDEVYPYINNKIAFDHLGCFDKWSKCPFCFPIPANDEQRNYVLEKLEFVGTQEGFDMSNSYEIQKWEEDYPKKLKIKKGKSNEKKMLKVQQTDSGKRRKTLSSSNRKIN